MRLTIIILATVIVLVVVATLVIRKLRSQAEAESDPLETMILETLAGLTAPPPLSKNCISRTNYFQKYPNKSIDDWYYFTSLNMSKTCDENGNRRANAPTDFDVNQWLRQ